MSSSGPKKSKIMFFQNCLAMLGICLGIITGHFGPLKKMFFFILLFPKVVYRPLGYYLASSLNIFSPEINIFESRKKSKNMFLHMYFLFSGICKDK